jgi:hypothetical protein
LPSFFVVRVVKPEGEWRIVMAKFTDEELAMLSDEERAAIADDTEVKSTEELRAEEEAEAARVAKEDGAGQATRVVEKTAAEKAAEDAAEAEAKAKAAADAETAAKVQADKEAEDKRIADDAAEAERLAKATAIPAPVQSGPLFILESEKKHGTEEEIKAKMAELDTKFEDGDIKLSEYNTARAEYVEALTEMKMFSTINAQVQKAAAEKGWKDSQAEFFRNNAEYLNERIKNVSFVDAVNRLLATDESKAMTDAQIFEAAKKECDTVFYPSGRVRPGGAQVVDLDTKRNEAEAKRKADEAKALTDAQKLEADKAAGVKTLAKVPVAEGNAGDDKYDVIDKLTGDAYENAIAKMSDAERAVYAARA